MSITTSYRRLPLLLLVLLVVAAAAVSLVAGPPRSAGPAGEKTPPVMTPPPTPSEAAAVGWKGVEELEDQQRFQAALELVEELHAAADRSGDEEGWTRALVEATKLRMALHGYETAVEELKAATWPQGARQRAVLDLFYAQALTTYVRGYSWEIRQRERVETTKPVDLKAWTLDRIVSEAHAAFLRVWSTRADWGGESIGELARYLAQNSYPARIRGTLRDSVTYLWVELLADTSLWRPEQANELFRLDLPALLAGDPEQSAGVALDDLRVHPVVKICALLDDLEAWHRSSRRPEAALEARLERVRRLAEAFTGAEDRLLIRRHLEGFLADFDRSLEWWSAGQAELAKLVQEEVAPDALVRALAIARDGERAHPDSVGGQRCRSLAAAIEAPAYNLEGMASDGLDRRSLGVTHRNLDRLYLRAYRLDLERVVGGAKDYNLLPGWQEVPEILDSRQPDVTWSVELPPTPDFRDHRTDVVPPIRRPGAYLVVASARQDFAERHNDCCAVNLVLGDLVLLTRPVDEGYQVEVRSGSTGRPVAGVEVNLYRYDWQQGHHPVATLRTGADGAVVFALEPGQGQQHFLVATRGDEVALDQTYLAAHGDGRPSERTAALVYTDRSVYRPRQPLHFKVVAFAGGGPDGRFKVLPATRLTVTLRDANREEVTSVAVTTNDFGSASGVLDIPAGRLLGQWSLEASIGGAAAVRVEEYKRPTFEATVAAPTAPLRLNRPAVLSGEARYYFGLPVTSGSVAWRVTRVPVYPRWWYWWRPVGPAGQAQVVASGSGALCADGSFQVGFTPAADEREAKSGVTYRYRLAVEVTDEGGETRTAERTFRLGFVSVEAMVTSDLGFLRAGEAATLTVSRSDLDGSPRAGHGSWRLVRLEQPAAALLPADQPLPEPPADSAAAERYRTDGDLRRPRWNADYDPAAVLATWKDGREVTRGELEHGADGSARLELKGLEPGAYRVVYTTADDFGATCRATRELVVAGARTAPVALPALLSVERPSVPVGGTARLVVRSGLKEQDLVLELFRDGRCFERRTLRSGRDRELVEIPVTQADRGGFGVTLTLLSDHQLMRQSATVFVPWDDRTLDLEMATFRDRLRPGSHETFRLVVRSADGAPLGAGAAEVLAYMYDRSLDLFAPHRPPRPLDLYPNRSAVGPLSASLGAASQVWRSSSGFADVPSYPYLSGDRLKALDGYGIGGPGARYRMGAVKMSARAAGAVPAPALEAQSAEMEMDGARQNLREEAPASTAAVTEPTPAPVELRTDFSESAFFLPHLVTEAGGAVAFEFEVPDSVTEWSLWLHALTRDLRSGSLEKHTRSVKELMVRPYLPRFLREGDQAELRVVVNNAGETPFAGRVELEIMDPDSGESLLSLFGDYPGRTATAPFEVEPGGGGTVVFPITAPARVGTVAFKVTARAGDFSDGEQRALPVLPGRMHLVQSRFVTLKDRDRRELTFADMAAGDDPSLVNDQLVVTVDAQLFYGVLNALPYLIRYPYECTEQTLNRFLSTGIVTSVFDRYPSVARMAKEMAARETRLETWDAPDPNRTMALEETPWLVEARGGSEKSDDLIRVLDPRIAKAEREDALAKLAKAQTSLGAFPWWPGGPPSPYMTLYLLYGFSKALEFQVEVPKDMVVRAWSYMHRHYVDEVVRDMMRDDCCWEMVTFLNFVLSSYPDDSWTGGVFTADDRQQMLDFSFRHWKRHSPLCKLELALTLERAGRAADANLVFASVMDSAQTTPDEGTFWAPEDRAWLWYNDTIETHAFALRAMTELEPKDGRRQGLVHWLLLNKKLNHWKSTRATAEVVYALVHYLEAEGQLGIREAVDVTAGPERAHFEFDPDRFTGQAQLVIPGKRVDGATMSTVVVEKETPGFAFASATWHFSTEKLPEEARGDLFQVERTYFRRVQQGDEWVLEPLADGARLAVGDQVEVQLSIRAKHAAEYLHLRDPRGSGLEPEKLTSGYRWDLGIGWYEEIRDSGTNFFFEWLPAGEYTLKHRLRVAMAGTFRVSPATLQSMYAPEFAAYSSGAVVRVEEGR